MTALPKNKIIQGDCLEILRTWPSESIQCCVTSPPYWGLRDYGHPDQIGLEENPNEYVVKLVNVFHEVKRLLRPDGTLWLNLGDSYAGTAKGSGGLSEKQFSNAGSRYKTKHFKLSMPAKNLIGIPWRVAFALQADGWYLRSEIIWAKPNPMPESVKDRPTKSHEHIFLLAKSRHYYYDADAIRERNVSVPQFQNVTDVKKYSVIPGQPAHKGLHKEQDQPVGRNKRDVWTVAPAQYRDAHFAVMPCDIVAPCILAGSKPGDVILDPFMGTGTVALVAHNL